MRYLTLVLVVLGGAVIPIQVAANKRIEQSVRSPVLAAAIALFVGSVVLGVLALTGWLGRGWISGAATAPWWVWLAAAMSIFCLDYRTAAGWGSGDHRRDSVRSTFRGRSARPIRMAWRSADPIQLVANRWRSTAIGWHLDDATEMNHARELVGGAVRDLVDCVALLPELHKPCAVHTAVETRRRFDAL